MRSLLWLALVAPLAGCFTCAPTLDVRHCPEPVGPCNPGDAQVIAWNPDLQPLFPDVHRFVTSLADGEHGHARWTPSQAEGFWRFHHIDPAARDKQVFLDHDGQRFRVRVLDC